MTRLPTSPCMTCCLLVPCLLVPCLLVSCLQTVGDAEDRVRPRQLTRQALLVSQRAAADSTESGDQRGLQVHEILTQLALPGSLTVQPETGRLHFVENGMGSVRRLTDDSTAANVLIGLSPPTDPWLSDQTMGPYQVVFLDQNHLVVGMSSAAAEAPGPLEEGWLRLYRLSGDNKPLSADPLSPQQTLPVTEQPIGPRKLLALVVTKASVFLIAPRDATEPWLARASRPEEDIGPVENLAAAPRPALGVHPTAMTIDPEGNLVVAQHRASEGIDASRLTFCHARTGEVWVDFPVTLPRISALAYHPVTGRLFALAGGNFAASADAPTKSRDNAAEDEPPQESVDRPNSEHKPAVNGTPQDGGLFELVATRQQGKPGVSARKLLSLQRPSSMAFDNSGALYITQWGSADDAEDPSRAGALLRVDF